MKAVIIGYFSEVHEVKASIPRGYFFYKLYMQMIALFKGAVSNFCCVEARELICPLAELSHLHGGKTCLPFNTTKTKLVTFRHRQTDLKFTTPIYERLSGLKLNPDLVWNSYIRTIANDTVIVIGFLYLYKSPMRPRTEYCCSALTVQLWQGLKAITWSCRWWVMLHPATPFLQKRRQIIPILFVFLL